MLRILSYSAISAAAILLATWFGVGAALYRIKLFEWRWLDLLADAAIAIGTVFGTAALFGAIAALLASLMLDRVAAAVERRWYPNLPPPRRRPMAEDIRLGISFLGATIGWNVLALPFYLLLPAINVAIFLMINGYLLGREYFELVALRRIDRPQLLRLRRTYSGRVFVGGVMIAALSFLPLANLFTPVIATAFMMHLFYGLPSGAHR